MAVKVKICGMTNVEDALIAVEAGADALGFVFWKGSARHVEPATVRAITRELPPFVSPVGVFVDETVREMERLIAECGLAYVQLHGQESPELCAHFGERAIKVIRVKDVQSLQGLDRYHVRAFLLDAYADGRPGGTGRSFDWALADSVRGLARVIIAGGLTPENVAEAIRQAQPWGVDVSSGVERVPGKKDPDKVHRFIAAAKEPR